MPNLISSFQRLKAEVDGVMKAPSTMTRNFPAQPVMFFNHAESHFVHLTMMFSGVTCRDSAMDCFVSSFTAKLVGLPHILKFLFSTCLVTSTVDPLLQLVA